MGNREYTQSEVDAAAAAEDQAIVQDQINALRRRNVALRLQLQDALQELAELREKPAPKQPQDRRPPAKKTAAKKAATPRKK